MKNQHSIDYSLLTKKILFLKRRREVGFQILKVIKDYFKGKDIKKLRCLDIGTSSGAIAYIFANSVSEVIGIDVDKTAAARWKRYKKKNLKFELMDALNLKFKNESFDVVIANQVYNYVKDPEKLMSEIYRVLKTGGVCFFGAKNKLTLLDGQYGIPFLSLLPKNLAKPYLRLLGKNKYFLPDDKNIWQLKELCKNFRIYDYTLKIINNPHQFGYKRLMRYKSLARLIPSFLLEKLEFLIPNYIWILVKDR